MALRWDTVAVDCLDVAALAEWWRETLGRQTVHIDLAPHPSDDRDAEIARPIERGARLVDVGQGSDVSWTVLADPEGSVTMRLSNVGGRP